MRFYFLSLIVLSNLSWAKEWKDLTLKERVEQAFNQTTRDNMDVVDKFYAPDVFFKDPVHNLQGRDKVKVYYQSMYKDVEDIHFEFSTMYEDKKTVVAVWVMTIKTKKLKGGDPILVEGNSIITFNDQGQASYHRDYFDMGEMVYEHIPFIGYWVRKIKSKLSE